MAKKKRKLSRKARRRRRRKIFLIVEIIVLLLLLLFLFAWLKLGLINFTDLTNFAQNNLDAESREMLSGYTNIACFGVDNRSNGDYDTGNSDSIIIVSINNDSKEVKLMSVYRDTAMDVDGEGTIRKCNYAYNHGGAKEAVDMLNRNLDLNIDKYVAVDFYALVDAIDAVGGVTIEVSPQEAAIMNQSYIDYTSEITGVKSSHVEAGTQTLDGVQAVSYCRVRYTAGGDFMRASRQRIVLQALVNKVKDASPAQLNKLVEAVFPNISTNIKLSTMLSLATAMSDYTIASSSGFPFALTTGTYGSKGSLDIPCTLASNVTEEYKYLFGEDHTPSETVQDISDSIEKFSGKDESDAVDYSQYVQ